MLIGNSPSQSAKSLPLSAFDGWHIPNGSDSPPGKNAISLAREVYRHLLNDPTTQHLLPPTGRYNCHGLVFASRRTNVPPAGYNDDKLVDTILSKDGYRQVNKPQPGDVVAYRTQPHGEIAHTGFVSRVDLNAVFVWSAWGSLGEFEHHEARCPYIDGNSIEYWRLVI